MTSSRPVVSILIVTYNSADVVGECLDSIDRTLDAHLIETIVVDNNSQDETLGVVRVRPWVHLIESDKNLGFAAGNNLAAQHARGEYLLLLNPDTVLRPRALQALVAAMGDGPDVWVTGSCQVNGQGELARCWGDFPDLWWVFANQTPWRRLGIRLSSDKVVGRTCEGIDQPHEADWVSGASLLVRGETWSALGGLSEEFFMYFEETDLCSRVWRAGGRVLLVPDSVIVHLEGASIGHLSTMQLGRFMDGLFIFLARRDGMLVGLAARAWILIVNTCLALYVGLRRGFRTDAVAPHLILIRAALNRLPRPS